MEFVRIIYLLRKPDAYKGKGLIPSTITLRLKEGKKSKK